MAVETLHLDIKQLTEKVLHLTKENCWNPLSDTVVHILSEVDNQEGGWQKRIAHRRSKDLLHPMSFDSVIRKLEEIYSSLHDINLYVHRAEKDRTIVDVQYFLKEKAGSETGDNVPSKLHAKVLIPPYRNGSNEKFDVHWEFGGLRHRFNMLFGRLFFLNNKTRWR